MNIIYVAKLREEAEQMRIKIQQVGRNEDVTM